MRLPCPLPAYVYGVASDNVPKRLVVDRYASTLKRLYFLDNQLLGTKRVLPGADQELRQRMDSLSNVRLILSVSRG